MKRRAPSAAVKPVIPGKRATPHPSRTGNSWARKVSTNQKAAFSLLAADDFLVSRVTSFFFGCAVSFRKLHLCCAVFLNGLIVHQYLIICGPQSRYVQERFPQHCLGNRSSVGLSDDSPFSSFQGRSKYHSPPHDTSVVFQLFLFCF